MGQLSWSLADPSLDLLGRAGVAAIALALDAAEDLEEDLAPLEGHFDAMGLTLSWPDDVTDQEALSKLVAWAWQTRNAPAGQKPEEGLGVLYFPGIHRTYANEPVSRLVEHSGALSTFLQHPRVQPKTPPKTTESRIDDKVVRHRYVEPKKQLAHVKDFTKQLFKRKKLIEGTVIFSSYLLPGATARYPGEDSWTGRASQAIPLVFAPTACFYLQVRGADWVVVAADPYDLEEFVRARRVAHLSSKGAVAASSSDAALRVLVEMRIRTTSLQLERRRDIEQECFVMRVGKVAWNRQSVRSGVFRVRGTKRVLDAFELVERHLSNRLQERKKDDSAFVTVASPRLVITDNLVEGTYWYRGLFEAPRELREQVEKNRKTGESVERTWFRWIRRYRKELGALMTELEELGGPAANENDTIFREAFHEALRRLYGKEAEMAKRGARSVKDRLQDRTEKIRRDLTKAQTRHHLRGVVAELFAESGRNATLQANADAIWRFIDDPREWRRARDLALLSLATYAKPGAIEDDTTEDENVEDEG